MWIGILTPGEHPARRAPAMDGFATISCWNDIARMRVDGPYATLPDGLRMLRATMLERGQSSEEPRCFACGCPYDVPDAAEARGRAQDWEPPDDLPEVHHDERYRDGIPDTPGPARYVLVHLEDEPGDYALGEEEVLVVVPSVWWAMLVPLDALDRMLTIVTLALDGAEPERCPSCELPAPGDGRSADGERSRPASRGAARRRAARRPAA